MFDGLEFYSSSLDITAMAWHSTGAFISLLLISSSHFWRMASETTRDEQKSIDDLIMEIVNVPEGYTCFLCSTTSGDECIWYELKDDIVSVGNAAMTLEKDKMPNLTLAEVHTAACYACYQHYIFMAGSWVAKQQ